jgi:hypothetical protein
LAYPVSGIGAASKSYILQKIIYNCVPHRLDETICFLDFDSFVTSCSNDQVSHNKVYFYEKIRHHKHITELEDGFYPSNPTSKDDIRLKIKYSIVQYTQL